MSDYGASINIIKKDHTALTGKEVEVAVSKLSAIITAGGYTDSLNAPFIPEVNVVEGEESLLHIILSNYWHGEGDDEENFEFAQDNDLGEVEKIAEDLQKEMGDAYIVNGVFEEW